MFKNLKRAVIIEVLIHLLFWAFITLLPILSGPYANLPHHLFSPWRFVSINFLLAIQFYLNAFFLIPVILNKHKKIGLYFVLLLLSSVTIYLLIVYTRPQFPFPRPQFAYGPPRKPPFFAGFNLLPLIAITAAGFAYRYLADQFRVINNKREIVNATLVSELAFLRSQISPHFIFNVINSVVALSRLNPALVEPTLMELSKLLRYMLYITDEEKVTLVRKADYLRSYIELQKLRFQDIVRVNLKFDIAEPEKTIEPMLLIPFVENAFKHGTGDVADPVIDIYLKSDNKLLVFTVENTYNPYELSKDNDHGIGLTNVKRRLELLYPDTHSLIISQGDNIYKVNLQIQLK
jgi:two-component system LytT family sensor kinase